MTLNLDQTLAWRRSLDAQTPDAAAELAMLNDLQGNILKGHGRAHTSHLFVTFDPSKAKAARRFLASLGRDVTSALEQLTGTDAYRLRSVDAGAFISVLISARGYDALDLPGAKPQDPAFLAGMHARDLNDPPAAEWEAPFQGLHAMILVAASNADWRDAERLSVQARIAATQGAVTCLGFLDGDALFNDDGRNIEHFGYVDGRSQPLGLQEDVDHEAANAGITQWNPAIHLRQLLVPCPGGTLVTSHGSYMVVRKLEQFVRQFKLREKALADALEAEGQAAGIKNPAVGERAGASVVGRFENGTPVVLDAEPVPLSSRSDDAVPNDFDYRDDQAGLRCPYAAHIRKTNPRADTPDSKSHLMARRGIPYGKPDDHPNDDRTDNKPEGGVGLIFMAYQADIVNQFEFTQNKWVDNRQFARPLVRPGTETGIDPVIGQLPSPPPNPPAQGQIYPLEWGQRASTRPFDFSGFVAMRGGEYLFAPSISFLRTLA